MYAISYGQTLSMVGFEDEDALEEFTADSAREDAEKLSKLSEKRMSEAEQKTFKTRLIKRADAFYDKMWYSEAAQLYDIALEKSAARRSADLLQRAGDSHYFNSNMEMAHHWYERMFKIYQSDIPEPALFKYAHVLKGTGRYRKAKRILRAFGKNGTKEDLKLAEVQLQEKKEELFKKSIEIKNLDVNSPYSEFSPILLNNNKLVFASAKDSSFLSTRKYKWNDQPYLDLYVGDVSEASDKVKDVSKLSKSINSKYHEAAASFSPDNQTMYFTRNNYGKRLKRDKNGVNHLKIYMSKKSGGEWSEAVELPFNSEEYSTGHPAVSPDGKKLYFVSDRPGGFGSTDIYVSDILENGMFSEPKNLGRAINTNKKEMFPFVSEGTIYFSSDRALGLGGLDVYKASFSGDTFGVASNVGQPINSNRDDFSYVIDEDTKKGYFASNRKGGKGDDDIYSFEQLIIEHSEDNSSIIAGTVTELVNGEVLPNALVSLLDQDNNLIKEEYTREDGSFVFDNLEKNTNYTISTNDINHIEDILSLNTEDKKRVELDIVLKKHDDDMIVYEEDGTTRLKTDVIYFDFDRSTINASAAKELDKLVDVWAKYPNMVIKIESHTDSRGSNAYNQYLSETRAKSTKDYLVSKGIHPSLIQSAMGYGEERPVNDCKNGVRCEEHYHKNNRRSEFVIVKL